MYTATLCILTYGDHTDLAKRCLQSLVRSGVPLPLVADIRVGLNTVSDDTDNFVAMWAYAASCQLGIPVRLYTPAGNSYKYPTMRRMFRYPAIESDYAIWFDDDSYVSDYDLFWDSLSKALGPDMLGQIWHRPMTTGQWRWIQQQPWYQGLQKPDRFSFCTGGFWALRSDWIAKLDWPIPELKHCGGDCMLCEALRHCGASIVSFDRGVQINADQYGNHSKAERRGYTEPPFASYYNSGKLPTEHQEFEIQCRTYFQGEQTCAIC